MTGRVRDTIRTRRFVGRRIAPTDLEDFQAFYADPKVMSTLAADGRVWPREESAASVDITFGSPPRTWRTSRRSTPIRR